MGKIKCEDCRFWRFSHEQIRKKRGEMLSLSWMYSKEAVGWCGNDKCGRETSGYTGLESGHKMSRIGGRLRYCQFFEPKPPNQNNKMEENTSGTRNQN